MKKTPLIVSAIFCLFSIISFSQEEGHDHEHDHEEQKHEGHVHNHKNELSIATGVVPLFAEDEITAGLHLHYIRGLGETNRFGIGIGLEYIIDEHKHYTASAVFQYGIYKGWIVAVAPGLLIRKEEENYLYQGAVHIETGYEFQLGKFHIGPVAELGIEPIGFHVMGGIHFGISF